MPPPRKRAISRSSVSRVMRSITFEPGSVVAIVGENGAGKSTLVKLLCRMYQPSEGRILVDGVDLARIRADEWRSRLVSAYGIMGAA